MAERVAIPDLRLKKPVVMVGMMGAGKTAVGRAVAGHLHVPFLDSDHEIETAANMTIAEIFARDGEPFFRVKEAQVIARLLAGPPMVLSTGGGAFMQEDNRALVARLGVSVWLKADLDTLWARVKQKATRPLLRTADPYGTLAGLVEARDPTYALADVTVRSETGFSIDQTARRVIDALKARPDVLETPE
ncbi:shikimate kinase [Roseivivax halodurans JCM 10272]|uniref:Shikimate kinase n=1 Tax=Roseivivax halodurans JCM 10272 TaxID=1449350 RepID=X7EL44_9RHOB|nr:shikimate kinase [Roseivivax halodurans]ETX16615.1 shikimate kinase [Roseivivax halodurans JCM 10272]